MSSKPAKPTETPGTRSRKRTATVIDASPPLATSAKGEKNGGKKKGRFTKDIDPFAAADSPLTEWSATPDPTSEKEDGPINDIDSSDKSEGLPHPADTLHHDSEPSGNATPTPKRPRGSEISGQDPTGTPFQPISQQESCDNVTPTTNHVMVTNPSAQEPTTPFQTPFLQSPFTPTPTPVGAPTFSPEHISSMQAQMASMAQMIESLKRTTQRLPVAQPSFTAPTADKSLTRGLTGDGISDRDEQDEQIAALSNDSERVVVTIFRTMSNQDVPFGDGYMNMTKLQQVLLSIQYASVKKGDVFSMVGPCFVNLALFQASLLGLDGRNRIIFKMEKDGASQVVISVMVGGVQHCSLVHGTVQGDHSVKKITITPTDLTMSCFRHAIRRIFKRPAVRIPLETDTEISFSTKREGAKSFASPKKKSSKYYGSTADADPTSARRDLRTGRSWAELANQMSVIDFEGQVPIYDATELGFSFDKAAFSSLKDLPPVLDDIGENAIVAVGFTTNLWGIGGTSPPAISLNVQFVIVLSPPPLDNDSD